MENNNATLVEAKKAYTNQLISLITPQIYEGIKDLYECAKKNMKGKNVRHSFQIELSGVSVWNQLIIDNETERIIKNTNCGYLDKLVTVIFINSTKILASAYIGSQNTNTLEISVPKLSHFIHRVYIETAKEFYKNPFLLDENLRPRERQDNLRSSIEAIKFGIEQAILRLLPIGEILSRDVVSNIPQLEGPVQETSSIQDEEEEFDERLDDDIEEESDEEEEILETNEIVTEEPNTESVEETESIREVVEDVAEPVLEHKQLEGNVDETDDESVSASDEENFITKKVSQTGSVGDGLSIENINDANKEFIEEKKEDPTLVDDIVEEINLKNIELEDTRVEERSNEPLTVNKIEESAVVEEPLTPSSPVIKEVEETVLEDETEPETERIMESNVVENIEDLDEDNVSFENEEEDKNMNSETYVTGEQVAEKTNEMIRGMKRDLHMNKKRFVNPYRAKHQMNENRLERLRNIRVKKNSGLGLSQYI